MGSVRLGHRNRTGALPNFSLLPPDAMLVALVARALDQRLVPHANDSTAPQGILEALCHQDSASH
jgi:hypothetical protein